MQMRPTRSWSLRLAATAMAVAALTGLSACSSTPATSGSTSQSTSQHMAASDFASAVKAPRTIVLDVRTPAEFSAGHLPAAKNVDFEGTDFAAGIAALDKSATYALYCRSGNRSGKAMEQMAAAGFTHLYDLSGGISAWENMGGPMMMGGS